MLELINVSYVTPDGEKEILKNINLKIDDRFVAITGPNGSGKSTLAKLIAGIIKPTTGKILLDGVDITDMSVTERANSGVSFAFQQPVRFKGITVKRLITLAAGKETSFNDICTYLSEVGLCAKDYVNREVDASLSGGELKRIEIAMINARGTRLSVFDEPEAGIDLWSFAMLVETFKNMQRSGGGTTIIISHQERIMSLADEMLIIADGKIKSKGEKEELLPKLMCEFSPRCVKTEN